MSKKVTITEMTSEVKTFKFDDLEISGTIEPVNGEEFDIGYLDEVESECWDTFKKVSNIAGVSFDDTNEEDIDFEIAKDILENVISTVEETFEIKFPYRKSE